jgi:hypothetical protein
MKFLKKMIIEALGGVIPEAHDPTNRNQARAVATLLIYYEKALKEFSDQCLKEVDDGKDSVQIRHNIIAQHKFTLILYRIMMEECKDNNLLKPIVTKIEDYRVYDR